MSIESELLFAARAGWGGAGDPRKITTHIKLNISKHQYAT